MQGIWKKPLTQLVILKAADGMVAKRLDCGSETGDVLAVTAVGGRTNENTLSMDLTVQTIKQAQYSLFKNIVAVYTSVFKADNNDCLVDENPVWSLDNIL